MVIFVNYFCLQNIYLKLNLATYEPYKLLKTAISCNVIIACYLVYALFLVHNLIFQIIFDFKYDLFYIQAALLFI